MSRERDGSRVTVTVKSVNHRFLDVAVKAPQALGGLEARIRTLVGERLTRGRVEVTVGLDVAEAVARDVQFDEALLERIAAAFESARAKGLVTGPLTVSDVVRLPQVLEVRARTDAAAGLPAGVTMLVEHAIVAAIDALVQMRETEGRYLQADLDGRLLTLGVAVDAVEREARAAQSDLEARLRERLASLPADLQPDSAAVAQEVVRFVARSDVDEELVRFRAHLDHWRSLASGPEPCGRKLDFLVQELNRELNTLGSKAEGARAPEIVIGAKAELERVKEQVQNVE